MYIREVRQCGENRVADIRHFFKAVKIPPFSEKIAKKSSHTGGRIRRVIKPFLPRCSALSTGALHREL